jgi:peptide/nickel transport system ATP-binding protein
VTNSTPLLSVRDLHVSFNTADGVVKAVDGVSFDVVNGETMGIVGESGSGKSVMVSAIMRLNFGTEVTVTGQILLNGIDLLALPESEMRQVRGRDIAMIFQDPLSALNPFYTVGYQIAEAYLVHHPKTPKSQIDAIVLNALEKVGIPEARKSMMSYPHEFSGGMRQRIVIAMALINQPKLLIADEPTTALDVTVQAQILELIESLREENNSAVMLITHDLGVVAESVQQVMVMYAGRTAESAPVQDLFVAPSHPYTQGLLRSVRSFDYSVRGSLVSIPGTPPSLINLPEECAFRARCSHEKGPQSTCATQRPELRTIGASQSACHLSADEVSRVQREVFST